LGSSVVEKEKDEKMAPNREKIPNLLQIVSS